VWLVLAHPKVATRDCHDCQRWRYDESTGARALDFREKSIARFPGESLPCELTDERGESCCPKVSPTAGVALWPHNVAAYQHYKRCKAVGRFPDDSIVEANAAAIANVESQWDRMKQDRLESLLTQRSH